MKRKIAAIVAADVAGYSRLVAEDEEDTLRRLAAYREVYDDFIRRYGGRIFNTAGDAVLAEFESAVEAVRAAIDIQESLRTRNMALPATRKLQFRIGISIGDVVERDGDLLGDGVNIAARLEGLAEPGGICVSRSVHEAVANKVSVPFRDLGERTVKNIPSPIHAFVVTWPGLEQDTPSAHPERPRVATWLIGGGAAALVAGGLAAAWLRPAPPSPHQAAAPPTASPVQEATRQAAPVQPAPASSASASSAPASSAPTPPDLTADPAQAFALLARQGGLVVEPRTPPELYHNARVHEARGEAAPARQAYRRLSLLGQEAIDPYLRYAALLRAQEGRAGAREALAEVAQQGAPSRAGALVQALQFEEGERRTRLAAFAAEHPNFAPAHYLLAEEFGEERLGRAPTLAERRQALAALDRFLEADLQGRLNPFFLDQSVLAAWLDHARRRRSGLDAALRAAAGPSAQFTRANSGWLVSVTVPEAATSLAWRLGEVGPFRPTGALPMLDPRTGKPMPQPTFELPPDQGPATLQVRYEDANGVPSEPAAIPFEPRAALLRFQRMVLEMSPGSWVAFRRDMEQLLYFTHLVSYRCALSRVVYGLDGEPPGRNFPVPPCDLKDPVAIPEQAALHVTIPKTTRSVSVQLTYADGATSEVQTLRR